MSATAAARLPAAVAAALVTAALLSGTLPGSASRGSASPGSASPGGASPGGASPGSATPVSTNPGAATPEGAMSGNTLPWGPMPAAAASRAAPIQLLAAVHVHSTASSGTNTLPELARLAHESGVDVLVLAENMGYEVRYAPAPLRLFAEVRAPAPTLERYGISRFLAQVEEARGIASGLLLLPGVEVPPYYFWTGSLLRGDLTLHDTQRNVLIVPPPRLPGDSVLTDTLLRHIPAVGNRYGGTYGLRSLALLLPGLLLVAGALRALARAPAAGSRRRRFWGSLTLLAVGALLLYNNFPYSVPPFDPYDPSAGQAVARGLLEYSLDNGALGFWSMPQAVDYHDRSIGPLQVGLSTDPYAEALTETPRYTGFGGVYADTVTLWEAGDAWDEALTAFQSGGRARAPWIIGESAFHYSGQAGKQLADVVTVLLVNERSEEGAFSALGGGHSYALRRDAGAPDLRLRDFFVRGTADGADGVETARSGETLSLAPGVAGDVELVLDVDDVAGTATPVRVEIVRNGKPHRQIDATTPFHGSWRETLENESRAYYRVIVRATRAAYLVSNPVFVQRAP